MFAALNAAPPGPVVTTCLLLLHAGAFFTALVMTIAIAVLKDHLG